MSNLRPQTCLRSSKPLMLLVHLAHLAPSRKRSDTQSCSHIRSCAKSPTSCPTATRILTIPSVVRRIAAQGGFRLSCPSMAAGPTTVSCTPRLTTILTLHMPATKTPGKERLLGPAGVVTRLAFKAPRARPVPKATMSSTAGKRSRCSLGLAGAVTRRASKACKVKAVPKAIAGNTAGRECRCSPGPAGAVTRRASKACRAMAVPKAIAGNTAGRECRCSPGPAGAVTQKASEVPVGVRAFGRMLSPSCHPWVAAAVLRVPRAEVSPTCQTWWT
ncbi:hypothetical protein OH76DRAFT_1467880, partial [Lentinus brumalis]